MYCTTRSPSVLSVPSVVKAFLPCFRSSSTGRLYRLMYATNLLSGVWTNLPGVTPAPGLPGEMTLSDTNTAPVRFYRVMCKFHNSSAAIKKNLTTENTDFTDRSRDVLRHPFPIGAIRDIRG